jgi:hypothetical protein
MSRTNPYKKPRRAASQTLLMYGEGLGEEVFLKYLKGLYARDSGVAVTIRNGKGGNAADIIIDAANAPGGFDRRIVVLDNDKDSIEMQRARQEAKIRGVEIIENTPCLEALLLAILNDGENYSGKPSSWCKKEFESRYIDKKKRTEVGEYGKYFPKSLLDSTMVKVPELKTLISIMRGIG